MSRRDFRCADHATFAVPDRRYRQRNLDKDVHPCVGETVFKMIDAFPAPQALQDSRLLMQAILRKIRMVMGLPMTSSA